MGLTRPEKAGATGWPTCTSWFQVSGCALKCSSTPSSSLSGTNPNMQVLAQSVVTASRPLHTRRIFVVPAKRRESKGYSGINKPKKDKMMFFSELGVVAQKGDINEIQRVLEEEEYELTPGDVSTIIEDGCPFHVVEYLVRHAPKINAGPSQSSPFLAAVERGALDIVEFLLWVGADVEDRGTMNKTPLIRAAQLGHLEIVECLTEHGADVNRRDPLDRTALREAVKGGRIELVEYLFEHGATATSDELGELVHVSLFHAASFPVVECLLEHGANVNTRSTNYSDKSLLEHAATRGRLDVVEHLMDAGAEDDGTDLNALSLAKFCRHGAVVEYLRQRAATTSAHRS